VLKIIGLILLIYLTNGVYQMEVQKEHSGPGEPFTEVAVTVLRIPSGIFCVLNVFHDIIFSGVT
jgi:hypothetical protein